MPAPAQPQRAPTSGWAQNRRVELETMSDYRPDTRGRPPVLLLGYAQMPESAIRAGIHELAKAVRAARTAPASSHSLE
jgi:hypothetical protein